jgi:gamma-butyrobetaine dioxygenase
MHSQIPERSMIHADLRAGARVLQLRWPDAIVGNFPLIWLRDNDPAGFHPQTHERLFDLLGVPHDIEAARARIDGGTLEIDWAGGTAASRFDLNWLKDHRPGMRASDPADVAPILWRAGLGAGGIPRADAGAILRSDAALADWLRATKEYGLSVVEGLDDAVRAGMDVARRIGFLRETNFGVTFEVVSKPDPNNLAYTPVALPPHTDLANQELPPGFQFLHCLVNEAKGGGSVFCDGYAIAGELRESDAEAFDLLSAVSIPFRFHDETSDIRCQKTVIALDEAGQVSEICFNAHLADFFDLEPGLMERYYRAWRAFMTRTRDPAFPVAFKLAAGEMAVFDNRRVLHGREAFDPNTGRRHLHGCYVDRGGFDSRLRVLARS